MVCPRSASQEVFLAITPKNTGEADYQLHIEWRIPPGLDKFVGQERGNSGLYLAYNGEDGYELQILDSYNNTTYVNGQAGSLYKQTAPLVNAMRKPGEWQTYDVVFTAP